jgi:hypothetical protein
MGRRRHQVRERLAGPGAGLDRQVLAGDDGPLYRLRHRDLAGALRPADPLDSRGKQRGDLRPGSVWGRAARPGLALLLTGRHTGTLPRATDAACIRTSVLAVLVTARGPVDGASQFGYRFRVDEGTAGRRHRPEGARVLTSPERPAGARRPQEIEAVTKA